MLSASHLEAGYLGSVKTPFRMKTLLCVLCIAGITASTQAQSTKDHDMVRQACTNYLDGFYKGDTTLIIESFSPTLNKFGFWEEDEAKGYEMANYMSFEQAKAYARDVLEKEHFPSPDAPRKVEVLDVMNQIASAKITAWWGTDYLLLSKRGDKWMIEQVLWEGPLKP
jgi:hypothetical protein